MSLTNINGISILPNLNHMTIRNHLIINIRYKKSYIGDLKFNININAVQE